jgi:UDP-glucose 4-epimerase
MENILITGGTGYIGSHVALELLNSKFNVFVIDNLSNSSDDSLKTVEKITGKKITFKEGDVRNQDFLDHFFKTHSIDCVIHCAGLKAVAESIQKPYEYYQNNIIGSLNLIEAMKRHKVMKLIFSSSATVYDEYEKMPLLETSAIGHGQNPYARTKIMIEKILQDQVFSDPAWSIMVLRYFNPVGNDPSCLLGEDPKGIPNNLMPLINQAAFNTRKLTVFGADYDTPDGSAIRDYIHVSDLAIGHVNSVQKILQDENDLKIFNLGLGQGISVLQLINIYQDINDIKFDYSIGDRRLGDLPICYADNQLAKKELGWKPIFNYEDMCLHSYRWMKRKISNN